MQAACHTNPPALVQIAHTCLGQFVPRLDRRPVSLDCPLANLVTAGETLCRNPEVADCCPRGQEALLRLRPDPSDQFHPIDRSLDLFHHSYLIYILVPFELATATSFILYTEGVKKRLRGCVVSFEI